MSRDSNATYLHLLASHHADLLESFTHPSSSQIPPEDIYIPPHLQPDNPEDEDDVVPDQHAAFGIQRATQKKPEILWRDLGLEELMRQGPAGTEGASGVRGAANGGGGSRIGGTGGGAGFGTRGFLQERRDEPVVLALRRRPGVGGVVIGLANGQGEAQAGGVAGNGLPR